MDESQATAGPTPEADPLGLPGKTSGSGPSLCRWAWHWLCQAPPEDLQGPGVGELRKKLSTHSFSTRCRLTPQLLHSGPLATCLTHTPEISPRLPAQCSLLAPHSPPALPSLQASAPPLASTRSVLLSPKATPVHHLSQLLLLRPEAQHRHSPPPTSACSRGCLLRALHRVSGLPKCPSLRSPPASLR